MRKKSICKEIYASHLAISEFEYGRSPNKRNEMECSEVNFNLRLLVNLFIEFNVYYSLQPYMLDWNRKYLISSLNDS